MKDDFLKLQCHCDIHPSVAQVHFLGMVIKDTPKKSCLMVDVFDKREAFKFNVIRFPHMDSVIPSSIPYGVFKGLLFRASRICSQPEGFVRHAVVVARSLFANGCSKARLAASFRAIVSGPCGAVGVREFWSGLSDLEAFFTLLGGWQ